MPAWIHPGMGWGQRDSSPTAGLGPLLSLIDCAGELSPVPGPFIPLRAQVCGAWLVPIAALTCWRWVFLCQRSCRAARSAGPSLGCSGNVSNQLWECTNPSLQQGEHRQVCCELCTRRQAGLSSPNVSQECPVHSDSCLTAPPELQETFNTRLCLTSQGG